MQIVWCYIYIYDVIFITVFKIKHTFTQPQFQLPQWKITGMHQLYMFNLETSYYEECVV